MQNHQLFGESSMYVCCEPEKIDPKVRKKIDFNIKTMYHGYPFHMTLIIWSAGSLVMFFNNVC